MADNGYPDELSERDYFEEVLGPPIEPEDLNDLKVEGEDTNNGLENISRKFNIDEYM